MQKNLVQIHHYLSRTQIEEQICNMIKNVLLLSQGDKGKTLYIGDGRCHLDILFEK